jgi:ATP-dependent RNA helicase DDX19/DBP5
MHSHLFQVLCCIDKPIDAAEASFLTKVLRTKLVDHSGPTSIEVQRRDPNSPLYSVKSFEELRL